MGWVGTYRKRFESLDLIISLNPKFIIPGHGPVCGVEGAKEMKGYLEYLYAESQRFFHQGLTSLDAAKRVDIGPYGEWCGPAAFYLKVERAYREFRNEPEDAPWDAPWDSAKSFDSIYEVAHARGLEIEF